jgi:pimeloyl-ACP methyl ester carboxylesterase
MLLDHPLIAERYFFPRADEPPEPLIVDAGDALLMCRRVARGGDRLMLVCFHGNGEIVADYVGDVEPAVLRLGLDVFLAEYRGFGGSSGAPLLGKMLGDVDAIVRAAGVPVERIVAFGRSVGSIFAIELAHRHPGIAGLILESGIASPLERLLLRVTPAELGVTAAAFEAEVLRHLDHRRKLGAYRGPLLVLHARRDHLVDVSHAERAHAWAASADKELVIFPRGDHNSILFENQADYWAALARFTGRIARPGARARDGA